jgi:hypothetical protein
VHRAVAPVSRVERVEVLMLVDSVPDPSNVLSWTVDGRPPSAAEVRLLVEATVEDAYDVMALRNLEYEVDQALRWDDSDDL